MIQVLTLKDKENVKELWKKNNKTMSLPYDTAIDKMLNSGTFYGIYKDNILIAMGGLQVMIRKPENRIIHLCVKDEYKRHGYAHMLLEYIVDKIIELDNGKECIVDFKKDADNNPFCYKYIVDGSAEEIPYKSMTLIKGVLDFSKI